MIRSQITYIVAGIVLVACLIGLVFFFRKVIPGGFGEEINSARSQGSKNAPVLIVEYSDFQCPACAVARSTIDSVLSRHEGKVRLVYRHYPLESHAWASLAHRASECAAAQGRFWPYHDRLYEEQPEWSAAGASPFELFLRYAKQTDLDLDRFAQCLADPSNDQAVHADKVSGERIGIRSTPSFIVNGKLVVGVQRLEEEVEKALSV